MMVSVAQRRQQRAVAARLLLTLHASESLNDPERWCWEAIDKLPAWCMASAGERVELQRICGALFLSPEIRFWIQKPLLLSLQELLGEGVFRSIVAQADAMQLPRESLSECMTQSGIDLSNAGYRELDCLCMTAGATVLGATVHASLPREMLTDSLGVGVGSIDEPTASVLLAAGTSLLAASKAELS